MSRTNAISGRDQTGDTVHSKVLCIANALRIFLLTRCSTFKLVQAYQIVKVLVGEEGQEEMISEVLKTYLLDNIGADCIETGLLYSQAVINAVCDVLEAKAAAMPL